MNKLNTIITTNAVSSSIFNLDKYFEDLQNYEMNFIVQIVVMIARTFNYIKNCC
jgi:hypothetical protein